MISYCKSIRNCSISLSVSENHLILYAYGNVDIKSLKETLWYSNLSSTKIYVHTKELELQYAVTSNPLVSIKIKKLL